MGCHAGFQTTDAIIGTPVLDWAQTFAGTGTGFVGNTGFGLGNTDSVAFSEELMADFAGHLDARSRSARHSTSRRRTTSSRATPSAPTTRRRSRKPSSTACRCTAWARPPAALGPRAGTGAGAAARSGRAARELDEPAPGACSRPSRDRRCRPPASPSPQLSPVRSPVSTAATTRTPARFRRRTTGRSSRTSTLPATRTGLTAHGVVIDSLTSEDHTGFDPDNVRPTVDLTANEPEAAVHRPGVADEGADPRLARATRTASNSGST